MRLSEAIRLGAMIRPQAFGRFYSMRDVQAPGDVLGLKQVRDGSCAYGAAYEAVGIKVVDDGADDTGEVWDSWKAVLLMPVRCPNCDVFNSNIDFLIVHLNDSHRWTRERIADFVQTYEDAQAANAVDPQAQHRERLQRA